jgi:hypothetical protein
MLDSGTATEEAENSELISESATRSSNASLIEPTEPKDGDRSDMVAAVTRAGNERYSVDFAHAYYTNTTRHARHLPTESRAVSSESHPTS